MFCLCVNEKPKPEGDSVKKKKTSLQKSHINWDFLPSAEEGCAHAEVHPGGEHHHALLCTVGSG